MRAIKAVSIKVSLRKDSKADSLNFSRSWLVPGTVLHLSARKPALGSKYFTMDDG